MKILFLIAIFSFVAYPFAKNNAKPKELGIVNGTLAPCPSSPNCVSSYASDAKHSIAPFPLHDEKSLEILKGILKKHYNARIVKESPLYFHAVVKTKLLRFKDDIEFLVSEKEGLIHVRSASRLGYSDLGVNRSRLEEIRQHFFSVKKRSLMQ